MSAVLDTAAAERPAPSEIARFWPLDSLDSGELATIAESTTVRHHQPGAGVLSAGSDDNFSWYLRSGQVRLTTGDQREVVVDSDSNLGRYPISNLRPHRYSVTAMSDVVLYRMNKDVLGQVINRDGNPLHHVGIPLSPSALGDYSLFAEIQSDIVNDRVAIPSLPNIVVQIYRIINDEDADARKIARVIQADPAITAKLLSTANSFFYRRRKGVETCPEAIVRLGRPTVKNLVTSFVMQQLFQSKVPAIQHQVKKLWTHSATVAAISFNLARLTPKMNAETALLAGLLHDIGALCILGYAEKHPQALEDKETFANLVATFRGPLGGEVLRRWNFPEIIVNAALDAEDWHRDPGPEPDYSDLVLIAQLHSFAGNTRMWSMPRIYEVPAFKKMVSGQLTPTLSLEILDEAKQYIDETMGWLTS